MKAITQYLKNLGYSCAEDEYYSLIELWQRWYAGMVPSVHRYAQYNGRKKVTRTRKSLKMAKTVSEDWANLLLNEKVEITVQEKRAQEKIDEVLDKNRFRARGNQLVEMAFAMGTGAFVEFMDGKDLHIDYVRAGMIYPLSWDNGTVTECAFASERKENKRTTVYLNIHKLDKGNYVVENHLFERRGTNLSELDLPEDVLPEVSTKSSVPRFQLLMPNIANNLAPDSPLGLSIYANALDQLEATDLVYDSYVNEFRLGKKRITIPVTLARVEMEKDGTAQPVFDDDDLEFYALPQESGENKIQEHNMTIRAEEHARGIQDMLNLDSWKCGFGTRRYTFENGQVKTATEVISNNSDLYRNLRKHELNLNDTLVGLVNAIADMLGLGEQQVTVTFDDSIIEDTERQRETDRQEVRENLMATWEYRIKWYGEDETTAKARAQELEGSALSFG